MSSTYVIAVDPGKKGAIVVGSNRYEVTCYRMVDNLEIDDLIQSIVTKYPESSAYIEKQYARPQSDPSSMFKLGTNYGVLLCSLYRALPKDRVCEVVPMLWQKALGIPPIPGGTYTDNKNRNKLRAIKEFPNITTPITHYTADALLIWLYGHLLCRSSRQ